MRRENLRAHHISEIFKRVREVVKGVRNQYVNKFCKEILTKIMKSYNKMRINKDINNIKKLIKKYSKQQPNSMIKNREFKVSKAHSGRPILRKLTARIHPLDFKMDWTNKELYLSVDSERQVKIQLLWYSYLNKYLTDNWKLKEVIITYKNTLYVYLIFEKDIRERIPEN